MQSVSELLDAYKAAVQTHGSRSIRARDLLRQLAEARNRGLRKETGWRRKRRKAA